jgi:hypothetical protein
VNIVKQYNKIYKKYKNVKKTRNSKDAIILRAEVLDAFNSVNGKLTQEAVDIFAKRSENHEAFLQSVLGVFAAFVTAGVCIGLRALPSLSHFFFSFDPSKRFTNLVLIWDAFALAYCIAQMHWASIFGKFEGLARYPNYYQAMVANLDSIIISTNNFGE